MVFNRMAKKALTRLSASFPAVLVTGPRQTGKTTLLKNFDLTAQSGYVTFDDPQEIDSANADAHTFLSLRSPPVIFDEIQYVPRLFPYLKMEIDKDRKNGMYYLMGSQQFEMMKTVSESLAGRIGILHLSGISLRERFFDDYDAPFIPTKDFILNRKPAGRPESALQLWDFIQQGSYPQVASGAVFAADFYGSYVKTYVERDVRQLTQVADELQFIRFVTVAAARTAQLVNYADMARETGISEATAKKWLSVLVTSGLVYLLQPYSANVEKRIVKTPKLYFLDTGLAAWLTKWRTSEVLMDGAVAGAFFETFAVSEILKSFYNAGLEPPVYFYRDKDKIEIDLLVESDGTLYPVEIKKTASPAKKDAASFGILSRIKNVKIGSRTVLCSVSAPGLLAPDVFTVPIEYV